MPVGVGGGYERVEIDLIIVAAQIFQHEPLENELAVLVGSRGRVLAFVNGRQAGQVSGLDQPGILLRPAADGEFHMVLGNVLRVIRLRLEDRLSDKEDKIADMPAGECNQSIEQTGIRK